MTESSKKEVNKKPTIKRRRHIAKNPLDVSISTYPVNKKPNESKIPFEKKNGVLLCAIGKMENNYIREWVEHYKSLGFKNICLFDNNDENGERFEDVIGDYIDDGFVILKNARGFYRYQIESYNVCYEEYREKYKWIVFFDIDEFLMLDQKYKNDVNKFLAEPMFEKYNMVRVCWRNYTDSGLIKVENGNYNCKGRFTEYYNSDPQSKAFVKTVFEKINTISPHIMSKETSFRPCNAKGQFCLAAISIGRSATFDNAWLNHYKLKTIEEYVTNKMVRLWPTSYMNGGKDILNVDYFFRFNKKTKEKVDYANELLNRNGNETHQKKILINGWLHEHHGKLINFNWGDDINAHFLSELFGRKPIKYDKKTHQTNYMMIGTVINNQMIDNHTIIWGSGIQNNTRIYNKNVKVLAVRGPLTRKALMNSNIECPEVYGDPATLLPLFYNPALQKKYKYGIIPHWSNVDMVKKWKKLDDTLIIDLHKYKNWKIVIDQILSCECIISESLHGLIVSESYGIPNVWAIINENKNMNKSFFKYHDYFLSIGLDRDKPKKLTENTSQEMFEKWKEEYKAGNGIDTDKLLEACPLEIVNGNQSDGVQLSGETESVLVE